MCWSLSLLTLQAGSCLPVKFAIFLRTSFFIEHIRWLQEITLIFR